ncbi:hypothetical protein [Arcticibacter sp. MXS-1]
MKKNSSAGTFLLSDPWAKINGLRVNGNETYYSSSDKNKTFLGIGVAAG